MIGWIFYNKSDCLGKPKVGDSVERTDGQVAEEVNQSELTTKKDHNFLGKREARDRVEGSRDQGAQTDQQGPQTAQGAQRTEGKKPGKKS